jgi:hypothetical protein
MKARQFADPARTAWLTKRRVECGLAWRIPELAVYVLGLPVAWVLRNTGVSDRALVLFLWLGVGIPVACTTQYFVKEDYFTAGGRRLFLVPALTYSLWVVGCWVIMRGIPEWCCRDPGIWGALRR